MRILLHTSGLRPACVCMELYGSVIWRMEMSERGFRRCSACCVYGPAKSIHSSLNGEAGSPHHVHMHKLAFDMGIFTYMYLAINICIFLCINIWVKNKNIGKVEINCIL